jgi:hypothetical protein
MNKNIIFISFKKLKNRRAKQVLSGRGAISVGREGVEKGG